jgi:hypothetical protein
MQLSSDMLEFIFKSNFRDHECGKNRIEKDDLLKLYLKKF